MKVEIVFWRDMNCCKSTRAGMSLACDHGSQLCCAWHHLERVRKPKGLPALQAFARDLLQFWPLSDVFWIFNAGAEMSALALVCVARCVSMPAGAAREAYRADLVASTSPEFTATFDVLYGAAGARP
ncbi:hypothetical protein K2O51_23425 [Cupriavidus pinatubonensis]|uniref:hypothetical protein n=1 Tax=Cupriavidus pinatubonensis TaxID=248026 RepID=UPI001C73925B|nr:hypothetical protein [Cupriavidus pinatubonensis]QYY30323.1 hypothetical protein K2O51_23425 [Cupriavidus pinatubonensis]